MDHHVRRAFVSWHCVPPWPSPVHHPDVFLSLDIYGCDWYRFLVAKMIFHICKRMLQHRCPWSGLPMKRLGGKKQTHRLWSRGCFGMHSRADRNGFLARQTRNIKMEGPNLSCSNTIFIRVLDRISLYLCEVRLLLTFDWILLS